MICEKFDISVKGSTGNPMLSTYIIEDSPEFKVKKRPLVLICPGGGYVMTSDREAEMIALNYNAYGFNAAVLRYSVAPAEFPTALMELAVSVKFFREKAEQWHIDTDRIFLQGFSAGGHLVASYGCFWTDEMFVEIHRRDMELIRPNGIILGYPVISSGPHAHRDSFRNLLGEKYDRLVDEVSLEKKVNRNNPRTFIWATCDDELVPVENSLLFMQALKENGIQFEAHIYPEGKHGLSLGNKSTESPDGNEIQPEIGDWISKAARFIGEL